MSNEKEQLHKEVDMAYEIFEKLKEVEWHSWHRIIAMVEQLRNAEMRKHEEIQKAVYAAGRPIGLP